MSKPKIPNYNTAADAIDRLIVEVLKLAHYENAKREESLSDDPDLDKIVALDRNSRNSCEYRDMLKREIDRQFSEMVSKRAYNTLPASRTFAVPPRPVSELIAERCQFVGSEEFREELARALEEEMS